MPRRDSFVPGHDPLLDQVPQAGRNSMPLGNDPAAQVFADDNQPVVPQQNNVVQQGGQQPVNVGGGGAPQQGQLNDQDEIIDRILAEYGDGNNEDGQPQENAQQPVNDGGGGQQQEAVQPPQQEGGQPPQQEVVQPQQQQENIQQPANDGGGGQQQGGQPQQQQDANAQQPQQAAAPEVPPNPFAREAAYTEKDRANALKAVLVTKYKDKKENDDMKWADKQDSEMPHNDGLQKSNDKDKWANYVFYGSAAGAAPAGAAAGINFGMGILSPNNLGPKTNDFVNKNKTQDVLNGISAAGNALGTAYGVMKYRANRYRASHDKNANHRKVAKLRQKAGFFNAFNAASGLAGNLTNMGIFGSRPVYNGKPNEGSLVQKGSGLFDAISGVTGFVAKAFDFAATRKRQSLHKQTAQNVRDVKEGLGATSDKRIEDINKRLHDLGKLGGVDKNAEIKSLRERRHTAKAQKYAMEMAEKLHERKSTGTTKDWTGLISTGIGMVGSLMTAGAKFAGAAGGLIGTIGSALGGIGSVGALAGNVGVDKMAAGYRRGKKYKADKKQLVDEYLNKKAEKIKRQSRDAIFSVRQEAALGQNGHELSDHEAKMIAAMRLGQDPKYKEASLWEKIRHKTPADEFTDEIYDGVFDVLLQKRANNIMQSSKESKEMMLEALGLDLDASMEDVKAALNPDDDL